MRATHIIAFLCLANVAIFAYGESETGNVGNDSIAAVDSLAVPSDSLPPVTECLAGGPGSNYCIVPAGVDINGGVTGGCSVTCSEGYYACCGIRCICKPYDEK